MNRVARWLESPRVLRGEEGIVEVGVGVYDSGERCVRVVTKGVQITDRHVVDELVTAIAWAGSEVELWRAAEIAKRSGR